SQRRAVPSKPARVPSDGHTEPSQNPVRYPDPCPQAEKTVSENRIELLENMIRWSNVKGWALVAAMLAEVIAIGCIARAVWLALYARKQLSGIAMAGPDTS